MNSRKSKIILGFLVLMIVGAFVAYQIIYQAHPKTEDQEVSFEGSVSSFNEEISGNAVKWQNTYVLVSGVITSKGEGNIVMSENIFCQLNSGEELKGLSEGSEVQIKGRFIGYDDLLEESKLDNCILMNEL